MSDLDAARLVAFALRGDPRTSAEQRADARSQAGDVILWLVDEIECLRAAAGPDGVALAGRLADVRLVPVQPGPLGELAKGIAHRLSKWGMRNADGPTWDCTALPEAVNVMGLVDRHLRKRLGAR